MSVSKLKFPTRLDIVDMPTDQFNVVGTLRTQLCKVVNYCRGYPAKWEFLREVLIYTLERMEQLDEVIEQEAKDKAKKAAQRLAKSEGTSEDAGDEPAEGDTNAPAPVEPPAVEKPAAPAAAKEAAKPAQKPAAVGGAKVATNPVKQ